MTSGCRDRKKPYSLMHRIFAKYLSDPEVGHLSSDEAFLRHMLVTEIALAKVQAVAGLIPQAAADEIASALPDEDWDLEALAESTLQNGIPVIGLLEQARAKLSEEAREYLHWGATSQDITDTALVLTIKEIVPLLMDRLEAIHGALGKLEQAHGDTTALARTRNQAAVPIRFSQKIDAWRTPLQALQEELQRTATQALALQLAGAGSDLAAMGKKGEQTARMLAEVLDLSYEGPWHNQRFRLTALGDVMASLAVALGKIGGDVLLMAQSEVGEAAEGSSGGSSSMPHKNNPVLSEAMVTLAEYAVQQAAMLKRAALHRAERDGSALAMEWLAWPHLLRTVGASLSHGRQLLSGLQIFPERMKANLEATGGLAYSERAVYALSAHMPRSEAKKRVAEACAAVSEEGISLAEALQRSAPELNINWNQVVSDKT